MDLALSNLQRLICYNINQPTNKPTIIFVLHITIKMRLIKVLYKYILSTQISHILMKKNASIHPQLAM